MCINFIASDNVEPEKCDKNHEKKLSCLPSLSLTQLHLPEVNL